MSRGVKLGIGMLVATAAALVLRLPALDLRPMHIDEAIHTVRFDRLWRTGRFEYDPHDFHGPVLYYLTLPAVWLSGAGEYAQTSEATYRVVTVVCGVGLLLLSWPLGRAMGWKAACCAAILTAVSPAFSYYSRHYIMEMPLVALAAAAIVTGQRYARTKRIGWAIACGACLGLMHATKETCVLIWAAAGLAMLGTRLWGRISPVMSWHRQTPLRVRLGEAGVGVLTAAVVSVAAYSVFFSNWANVPRSVLAWGHYLHRAGGAGLHAKPWYYYFHLFGFWRAGSGPVWSEAVIFLLALVGIGVVVRNRDLDDSDVPLLRFLAVYTVLLTAILSIIPYKTPWTFLAALHGMILLAGVGWDALTRWIRDGGLQIALAGLACAALLHLIWQADDASFEYPADPQNPYVYAQTLDDHQRLVEQVKRLAEVHPDGRNMLIKVVTKAEDHWPLPWDLRGFANVGYWQQMPADPAAPVVITCPDFEKDMDETQVARTHTMIGYFELRPTVFLEMYVETGLWERYVLRRAATREAGEP